MKHGEGNIDMVKRAQRDNLERPERSGRPLDDDAARDQPVTLDEHRQVPHNGPQPSGVPRPTDAVRETPKSLDDEPDDLELGRYPGSHDERYDQERSDEESYHDGAEHPRDDDRSEAHAHVDEADVPELSVLPDHLPDAVVPPYELDREPGYRDPDSGMDKIELERVSETTDIAPTPRDPTPTPGDDTPEPVPSPGPVHNPDDFGGGAGGSAETESAGANDDDFGAGADVQAPAGRPGPSDELEPALALDPLVTTDPVVDVIAEVDIDIPDVVEPEAAVVFEPNDEPVTLDDPAEIDLMD